MTSSYSHYQSPRAGWLRCRRTPWRTECAATRGCKSVCVFLASGWFNHRKEGERPVTVRPAAAPRSVLLLPLRRIGPPPSRQGTATRDWLSRGGNRPITVADALIDGALDQSRLSWRSHASPPPPRCQCGKAAPLKNNRCWTKSRHKLNMRIS